MKLARILLSRIQTVLTNAGVSAYHVLVQQDGPELATAYTLISCREGQSSFNTYVEECRVQFVMSISSPTVNPAKCKTLIDMAELVEAAFKDFAEDDSTYQIVCTKLENQRGPTHDRREGAYVIVRDMLFKIGEK